MFRGLKKIVAVSVAAACLAIGAGHAQAESILVGSGPVVTPDGPNFKWDYSLVVTVSATVRTGDFFVIVDFAGLVPVTNFQPADWAFTTELITLPLIGTNGSMASALPGADNIGTPNLRWTYNGTAVLGPDVPLGNFGADSVYDQKTNGLLLAQDHTSAGTFTAVNSGEASVPAVPLPATAGAGLSLLGALAGFGGFKAIRRRRSVVAA